MKDFVSNLISKDMLEAKSILQSKLKEIIEKNLAIIKMRVVAEMCEELDFDINVILDESKNVTKSGRTKIIRVRIRGGKVQRRKKVSAVKGFTIRGGKLVRMSSAERRHRKMGARRAKNKRRAKLRQALRKRRLSLRKRKTMGLK
jgi:hypothetical protein